MTEPEAPGDAGRPIEDTPHPAAVDSNAAAEGAAPGGTHTSSPPRGGAAPDDTEPSHAADTGDDGRAEGWGDGASRNRRRRGSRGGRNRNRAGNRPAGINGDEATGDTDAVAPGRDDSERSAGRAAGGDRP